MLRKLFANGGHNHGNNHSSSASLTLRASGLAKEEWDERTGLTQSIQQLDEFEARLRELLRMLTHHCQAISEICTSTCAFGDQLWSFLSDDKDHHAPSTIKRQSEEAMGLVNMFRVSAVAPLQSLIIVVPQLRVRCEHRNGAMQLMLRYQRKVGDMERSTKTKSESTRLQRNRAKLQAATARFRDLDNHVQQEIRSVTSNDIAAIVAAPARELLVRAQLIAGQFAVDSALRLQPEVAIPTNVQVAGSDRGPETQEPKVKGEEPQDVPTPQRRLAMTVLASSDQDNNVYVRQSILAPLPLPSTQRLSVTESASARRQSTTTTTEDEEDDGDGDHEEDEYATIHEDFGIGKRKKHARGSRTWSIHQHIKGSMSTGLDIIDCVRLPDGFAREEWVAVHVVDFFNEINLLYGTISEFCTAEACPKMSAGPCYTYTWADASSSSAPQTSSQLAASQYVAKLMDWIESQISDASLFPPTGTKYRADFEASTASVVLKRLFRVYAHMYHSHLEHFAELSADVHLGFCFRRFVFFVTEFDLVEQKELNALRELVQSVLDDPVGELVPLAAAGPELLA